MTFHCISVDKYSQNLPILAIFCKDLSSRHTNGVKEIVSAASVDFLELFAAFSAHLDAFVVILPAFLIQTV